MACLLFTLDKCFLYKMNLWISIFNNPAFCSKFFVYSSPPLIGFNVTTVYPNPFYLIINYIKHESFEQLAKCVLFVCVYGYYFLFSLTISFLILFILFLFFAFFKNCHLGTNKLLILSFQWILGFSLISHIWFLNSLFWNILIN